MVKNGFKIFVSAPTSWDRATIWRKLFQIQFFIFEHFPFGSVFSWTRLVYLFVRRFSLNQQQHTCSILFLQYAKGKPANICTISVIYRRLTDMLILCLKFVCFVCSATQLLSPAARQFKTISKAISKFTWSNLQFKIQLNSKWPHKFNKTRQGAHARTQCVMSNGDVEND